MTELEALVGLNLVPEIGGVRLRRLLQAFGSVQEILGASTEHLQAVSGIGPVIAGHITGLRPQMIDEELQRCSRGGLTLLHCFQDSYPAVLKTIYDPPLVLYVRGSLREEDCRSLALVGSRRASVYGLACSRQFGFELAAAGFCVVSGMARGIDTAAHRGALDAGGRTLAVIGSGFGHLYPPENRELAQEISKTGAVISEFPFDTPVRKENFPRRNRLISGLSLGVLVVEAARNSGALITVDYALEQGRDVFAIPGAINSRTAAGVNELIRQGACLVCSSQDIIAEYEGRAAAGCASVHGDAPAFPVTPGAALPPAQLEAQGCASALGLSCIEEQVYTIIKQQPVEFDALCHASGLDVPALWNVLFSLLRRQLVKQLPGRVFAPAERPS